MKPLRIFIADDEPSALERIQTIFRAIPDVSIVGTAANGIDASRKIAALAPDVAILDVEMPGRGGLQVAAMLPREDRPEIVLVSDCASFALDAYAVEPLDYILKPAQSARLRTTLDRAKRRCRLRELARFGSQNQASAMDGAEVPDDKARGLWVQSRGSANFVPLRSINRVEAQREYALVHTEERDHLIRVPMRSLERMFEGCDIIRVHRSAFVRRSKIRELKKSGRTLTSVVMADGAIVPVGPKYAATLRKTLQIDAW